MLAITKNQTAEIDFNLFQWLASPAVVPVGLLFTNPPGFYWSSFLIGMGLDCDVVVCFDNGYMDNLEALN